MSDSYRHDVDKEACHLVKRMEDNGVLPGEDGNGDGAMAEHEVGFEPGAADARVCRHTTGQGLQQC